MSILNFKFKDKCFVKDKPYFLIDVRFLNDFNNNCPNPCYLNCNRSNKTYTYRIHHLLLWNILSNKTIAYIRNDQGRVYSNPIEIVGIRNIEECDNLKDIRTIAGATLVELEDAFRQKAFFTAYFNCYAFELLDNDLKMTYRWYKDLDITRTNLQINYIDAYMYNSDSDIWWNKYQEYLRYLNTDVDSNLLFESVEQISQRLQKSIRNIQDLKFTINNNNTDLKEDIKINKKENNKMFGKLNIKCGIINDGSVRMSIYGPAFCTIEDNYIAYKDNQTIDVSDMLLDIKMFYYMPVAAKDIKVNDYILHSECWCRVIEINESTIKAIHMHSSSVVEIVPTTNIFGFNFYTKLFVPFDVSEMITPTADNPFGNMLPWLLMSENSNSSNMAETMMLMSMMNNGTTSEINPWMFMLLNKNNKNNKNNNETFEF